MKLFIVKAIFMLIMTISIAGIINALCENKRNAWKHDKGKETRRTKKGFKGGMLN